MALAARPNSARYLFLCFLRHPDLALSSRSDKHVITRRPKLESLSSKHDYNGSLGNAGSCFIQATAPRWSLADDSRSLSIESVMGSYPTLLNKPIDLMTSAFLSRGKFAWLATNGLNRASRNWRRSAAKFGIDLMLAISCRRESRSHF